MHEKPSGPWRTGNFAVAAVAPASLIDGAQQAASIASAGSAGNDVNPLDDQIAEAAAPARPAKPTGAASPAAHGVGSSAAGPNATDRASRRHERWHALTAVRPLMWLVALAILCAWLLPGTLGHEPWKQDETYTFGIVQHMLDTGDLVVPTNAGQPFVEKPPVYDWVAAGFAWMFGRYLPLHDAARLASALFAGLTVYYTARVARRAVDASSWFDLRVIGTLALFGGTLVVVKHVHDMMTDVALMAGAAVGFCGLFELVLAHLRDDARQSGPSAADAHRRRHAILSGAAMFGAGVGVSLLAKGLFVPLVFGATTCAVLALYPACRSRSFAGALGIAMLVCAPFALIWPICFYLRSEALFKVWLWDNNVGRFFGFSVAELGSETESRLFVLRTVLSVGFPAVPLALAALAGGAWRRWRDPRVVLPALFAGIGFAVLQTSATIRELYILPFIAPLALLAMQGVERLPRRLHATWDMTSRVLFGSTAALAWIVWSIMSSPVNTHASLHRLGRWLPLDWVLPVKPGLIAAALLMTFGWLWLLPAFKYTGKWRGALSWCAGAILAWGLVSTLLLPWLDYAKSYRSVFENLSAALDVEWNDGDCMASTGLGESEAPMLDYYAGIEHQPVADTRTTECTWLIVESRRGNARMPAGDWRLFWSGARPGDNDELLRVFVRTPAATAVPAAAAHSK
ncbi:ArnT family glycosyltransferase [Paraburkholderia rhynchosiae]|uniref:Glycosyl transferase n=1 Tax=Paraburkholderia rhynchosiae TaxID=487049 RepID=A0A2N7WFF7_9BURK|nr:glycosyl transferase [Paraburkholderia rhynchosiae]PMS28094.1 glycosyl transferase [Paraburkholderia rhynchosiae]CAB3720773.1 Undecaprenyl phosphate-alpha-4-amino-4-deoxy-L-arabinose arabinosyl transferase [Paraburkholderia rhynchosiae]